MVFYIVKYWDWPRWNLNNSKAWDLFFSNFQRFVYTPGRQTYKCCRGYKFVLILLTKTCDKTECDAIILLTLFSYSVCNCICNVSKPSTDPVGNPTNKQCWFSLFSSQYHSKNGNNHLSRGVGSSHPTGNLAMVYLGNTILLNKITFHCHGVFRKHNSFEQNHTGFDNRPPVD